MNNDTIKSGDDMNSNETRASRGRRKSKTAMWLGMAGLCAAGAAVIPVSGTTHANTPTTNEEGMVCTTDATATGPVFDLTATDGYSSEPDGNAIYGWGFTAPAAGVPASFQLPGPVLCVTQGQTVTVNLQNNLRVATSIQFPGQEGVTSGGLPVGPVASPTGDLLSLVPEALPGSSVSYSFTATNAGTYVYESGSDPQLQVQMGLFGAIVVRPAVAKLTPADILAIPADGPTGVTTNEARGTTADDLTAGAPGQTILDKAACAYATPTPNSTTCDPLAIYDGTRENILMLSEVDPGLHSFMEQHKADVDTSILSWNGYPGAYEAHYFMINGRSMPDTLAPNNAPWLPGQPYGAMAHVQPWDPHTNPLDVLLRYVAVGVTGYDFHPHSNHEHVIATDGALMKGTGDDTEEKFNILVNPGSTVDATFRWTNEEGYSDTDGKRVPVTWPQSLNLHEGDFWSGSPYLGESGKLNPGILTKTQCGEYYHVAHSHDLTQATNYGITFGGMLTLIKVEPPSNVQGTQQGDVSVPVCNG